MRLDADVLRLERLGQQAAQRLRREAPVLAPAIAVIRADLADAGHGGEQHAARPQDAVDRRECALHVVDVGQRLRADEAVEAVVLDPTGVSEVGDQRRARIAGIDMDDVALLDAVAAVAPRVMVLGHFEHPALDVGRVVGQEALDVVAVDRLAAPAAEMRVDRRDASKVAEVERVERGGHGVLPKLDGHAQQTMCRAPAIRAAVSDRAADAPRRSGPSRGSRRVRWRPRRTPSRCRPTRRGRRRG